MPAERHAPLRLPPARARRDAAADGHAHRFGRPRRRCRAHPRRGAPHRRPTSAAASHSPLDSGRANRPRPRATRPGRRAVAARGCGRAERPVGSISRWSVAGSSRRIRAARTTRSLFRQPITTLDDTLRGAADRGAAASWSRASPPRGGARTTTTTPCSTSADLAFRAADPSPAVLPRLLRLRAARRDDVAAPPERDSRGVVPPPDLLLLEHLRAARARRSRLGAARQRGARLRARGGRDRRHARRSTCPTERARRRSAATSS